MKILITDSNHHNALSIVRECGSLGHRIYILSFQEKSLCSFSRFCYQELIISNYSDPSFLSELLHFLDVHKIDLVIPVGGRSVFHFSSIKSQLQSIVKLVLPDQDTIHRVLSKSETYSLAQSLEVPVPKTYHPRSLAYIATLKDHISFPLVVKPDHELAADKDVVYIQSYDALMSFFTSLSDIPVHHYIIQEYVRGEGGGFFAIYSQGQCGPIFQHRRIRQYPPEGGSSVCAESYFDHDMLSYAKLLLDHLNWHGVAMVEFKLTSNGPVFIEINPKFWGSLELAIQAGVSFPRLLIDVSEGKSFSFVNDFKKVRVSWVLGELKYLLKRPYHFFLVMYDLFRPSVKLAGFVKRDFRVFVFYFRKLFK